MNYSVDEKGHLRLGGISALRLKEQFGTPLYVMDEQKIRESMRCFTSAIREGYGGRGLICYASKAFCCKEIYRIAKSEGLGADIVSQGELYTARSAGFDMADVCMHGNNKSEEELLTAINSGVGRIVVDNAGELKLIDRLGRETGKIVKIMLRVKPGISAHTHEYIRTGQIDSKFGFALETGEAMAAAKMALCMPNVTLLGIHCHIGSQILLAEPFVLAAEVMINLLADIKEQTGAELSELNLGGGFGVPYTAQDTALNIKECLFKVFGAVRETALKRKVAPPFLIFEPGRSVVAGSGTTLYTVGGLKHIPDIRTYLTVDGGMCDNMRYILYRASYEMSIAGKMNRPKNSIVTVAGRCCESGDLLGENVPLQQAEAGDILAVFCTGAYNFSMYSTYNRNLRPAVVMVNGGSARIIVNRQTNADLVQNDI